LKKSNATYFIPAIIWTVIILVLTLMPSKDIPNDTFLSRIPQFDKLVHAGLFCGFVVTWSFGYYYNNYDSRYFKRVFSFTILAICLGVCIEFVQLWWTAIHRDFEILDMVADAIGASIGTWLSRKYLPKWFRKKPQS
jgi:VanZ family protein